MSGESRAGRTLTVGLIGNPNCGKTTLFNALTGAHIRTANWPGVTVSRTEGSLVRKGVEIRLVDLPGIYSLEAGSMEERVSADWLASGEADAVIDVINATALERNLYLTVQLLETGVPIAAALNLSDAAKREGIRIDTGILSEGLGGIPVTEISARRRTGLEELLDAVLAAAESPRGEERRGLSRRMRLPGPEERCRFAEELAGRAVSGGGRHRATERADAVLTHAVWGIPLFCLIMAAVFTLTFTAGDAVRGWMEAGLGQIFASGRELFARFRVEDWLSSLVFDGILSGVGGILTFLPNLLILYLAMAVLEDSGYLARAAYVMNETMELLGVSGKAFLPLLLGFGCTVPAAAATAALESAEEKKTVLRILPFISCSAKLPVYLLFAGSFFGRCAVFVSYCLCAAGAAAGLFLGYLGYRRRKRRGAQTVFLLELPDYRMPDPRTVFVYVREKVRDYLERAGSVIFLASAALWLLTAYGPSGPAAVPEASFAAWLGKRLAPLFAPAGFGLWQLCVALIGGISAKEVVVASCMVLFGAGTGPGELPLGEAVRAAGLTPAGALAFLTFCLLYSPCAAALASVGRESGEKGFALRLAVRQTVLAWAAAAAVFRIAALFV